MSDTHASVETRYASSKDPLGAQRTYEELLRSGMEEDETTLSNMVVAHSWGDVKHMKRYTCV